MLFSSMIFLWVFLPIVLIVNYSLNLIIRDVTTRIHIKNVLLLVASLIFYAWGGIYFLSIMVFSICINFAGGYLVSRVSKASKKKTILIITIVLNLLMLGYFKYFNMIVVIIEQIMAGNDIGTFFNNVFNMRGTGALNFKTVVLPIGISFFTFQAMSYVIDVYRGDAETQKNILDFGLYVALFPQLIAGPIVRYADVAEQINYRRENTIKFSKGIKRFCYGLGKKVILANTFALAVDNIYALQLENLGVALAIIFTLSYAMQIYYDFSGYSDMAIGLGLMFGFRFKENFNYPYTSYSVTEFWRRWHISLSTWFKEYVYIPLGGNRKGIVRTCINLMIVFLLTGIWHGANFTFIMWGVTYGIIQIIEKLFLLKLLNLNKFKIINFIYTFTIAITLFVIFRSDTLEDAFTIFSQYFVVDSKYNIMTFLSMKFIIVFAFGLLFMGPVQRLLNSVYKKVSQLTIINVIDAIIQFFILAYAILSIADGTYNPFIYFQF